MLNPDFERETILNFVFDEQEKHYFNYHFDDICASWFG